MYLTIGIIVVFAIYLVTFYNSLQTMQVQIQASIQEIGNQLKRQADLIPNLVESAKSYLKHEKSIFEDLTSARKLIDQAVKSNDGKSLDQAQSSINNVLKSLNVVMESNPEIKGTEVVSNLMQELRDTADKIMYARRTVIDLSADLNIKITTIPGMWIAPAFGIKPAQGLNVPNSDKLMSLSDNDTKNPEIKLN